MNTSNFDLNNLENLSEEQMKTVALLQYQDEDFFILKDTIFNGKLDDAVKEFLESDKDEEEDEETAFFDFCMSEVSEADIYDNDNYNNRYMVLTDSEADEKASESIIESLWAFTPAFLAGETGIDEEVFKAIQDNGRCESNNDVMLRIVGDNLTDLIENAIRYDGRGHFLNTYDGDENEVNVGGETFYIYRMN